MEKGAQAAKEYLQLWALRVRVEQDGCECRAGDALSLSLSPLTHKHMDRRKAAGGASRRSGKCSY